MSEGLFDLDLPPLDLEAGGRVEPHHLRGWSAGPERAPVVLVIHALTGDAQAGDGGWWEPVIGPGRALDTERFRVLCFNNLGSCYGSAMPTGSRHDDARFAEPQLEGRGAYDPRCAEAPPTLTTWDQARSLLQALDALDIDRVHLVTGGSLGAMITLCLAALDPERFERMAPIAGMNAATAWIIGFNHVARQLVLDDPVRGLHRARQLAMLTYRAEPGLHAKQGRRPAAAPTPWSPRAGYRVQTYLEYQGEKIRERFDPRAYLHQLDAMDHHDVHRAPPGLDVDDPFERIRASTLAVGIDTDRLYDPEHGRRLVETLVHRGVHAEYAEIHSAHGHDAFLIEWDQLDPILRRALALPLSPGGAPARSG